MVAGDSGGTANPEEWALGYININWVRKLVEALDGDASGFVTIKEVNDFTCSRPLDWRWVLGKPDLAQLIQRVTASRTGWHIGPLVIVVVRLAVVASD